MPPENAYDDVEAGWRDLIAAAARIQAGANRIKNGARSIDGYEIEKALRKHKPELMQGHLDGLKQHRKDHRL